MDKRGPPYGPFQSFDEFTDEHTVPGFGTFKPGDLIGPWDDPCEAAKFVNAVLATPDGGFSPDATDEALRIKRDCCEQTEGCPSYKTIVKATPEPYSEVNPSLTGSDDAPPSGETTAEQLGAPAPEPNFQGASEPPAPYERANDTLQQDRVRPVNPMPDEDIINYLSMDFPVDQLDDEHQNVKENKYVSGEPHHDFSRERGDASVPAADPVDTFSGQYTLIVTDIEIASRGFPLQFTRMYRSGPVYFGPWGYNWDHNYNIYLRELNNGGVAIWTGRLIEHVYIVAEDGSFEPPVGVFRRLERQFGLPLEPDRYVLSETNGVQLVFERPEGWPYPDRIPVVRVEDRHGNVHELLYDPEGRLEQVADHAGRFIHFEYGDCGLLERVTDHTGRLWQYTHDVEIEHLVAVTTPATPEYPEGLTTCYEYDVFREHPALVHNLTRVIDPAGQVVIENWYGDEPGTDDFGRVVRQEFGCYVATFSATRLQYVPPVPQAINVPALRVEVVQACFLTVYTFNYRGDLLDERFRLARDGSYRLVARVYNYDEQGNLIEQREPNGSGVIYTYDHENEDPLARANLLQVELVTSPIVPAPSRIVQTLTYEPQFHRIKTISDEVGNVTTLIYDYEEGVGTRGDVIRVEYPTATLPDDSLQPRHEHFEYNPFGQLVEHTTGAGHRHIFTYAGDGPSAGYLSAITLDADGAAQEQAFEYDDRGYQSAIIDGRGNRLERVYNDLGQVTIILLPAVDGIVDEIRFFYTPDRLLKREERPRGNYADDVITDSFIANEYAYDVLGRLTAQTLGINTTTPRNYQYQRDSEGRVTCMTDPLERQTRLEYDERGLLLTRTEAATTEVEAIWHYIYDRNGNRIAVTDPAGYRIDYEYDPWDRLSAMILPGESEESRTRMEFTLNHFDSVEQLRILGRTATGNMGTLFDTTIDYDERGRAWQKQLASQSTTSFHDPDERVVLQTDQRGNSMTFDYDGLNRLIGLTDPMGNGKIQQYDAAGNLVTIESREVLPDGGGIEILATEITYDNRNRPVNITHPLGRISQISHDARDFAITETDPLGQVVERNFGLLGELLSVTAHEGPDSPITYHNLYDLVGRATAFIDPEGHTTGYEYDARDRRTRIIYPDGRTHRFFYDARRQVAREETPGGTIINYTYGADAGLTHINFTSGPGVAVTPSPIIEQDGLRRARRLIQGDHELRRTYDESLRLVTEEFDEHQVMLAYDDLVGTAHLTYPDGRVDRLTFDSLGRLSGIGLETAGTADLTGTLAPGTEIARYVYRGPERVARRELHNGIVTELDYDAAARLTAISHRDASANQLAVVRYVYDAADRRRIVWGEPAPQQPARFDYDGLSRLREAALDLALDEPSDNPSQAEADTAIAAAEALIPSRTETYTLNRSDAQTEVTVEDEGVTTHDVYTLAAAYQITQLERVGPGGGSWPFIFDGDGRCIQDNRHRYTYDALGRLVEVVELSGQTTVLTQAFDPAGRVVRRTEGENTYEQVHHGLRAIQQNDGSGNPILQSSYGLGVDELVLESTGSNRYPLQDAASGLLCHTDATGAVLERYHYTPFGNATIWAPDGTTLRLASTIGAIPRFGGHPLLNVGLYDARARIYDPQTARFLQPDPLGYVDSPSLYTYANHDPIGFLDPTGQEKDSSPTQPSDTPPPNLYAAREALQFGVAPRSITGEIPRGTLHLWSTWGKQEAINEIARRGSGWMMGDINGNPTPQHAEGAAEFRTARARNPNGLLSQAEFDRIWGWRSADVVGRGAFSGYPVQGHGPTSTTFGQPGYIQGRFEKPATAIGGSLSGGLSFGTGMYSALSVGQYENPAVATTVAVTGVGEATSGMVYASGAISHSSQAMTAGSFGMRSFGGAGLAVASAAQLPSDIERGDTAMIVTNSVGLAGGGLMVAAALGPVGWGAAATYGLVLGAGAMVGHIGRWLDWW